MLVGDNKPTVAEPIYELDTGKLKIGDGIHDYKDLPYLSGEASDIVVQDPLDGQTLLYDATSGKWLSKPLADNESLAYYPEKGLAMAISKKAFGNKGKYFNEFKKWLPEDNYIEFRIDNSEDHRISYEDFCKFAFTKWNFDFGPEELARK